MISFVHAELNGRAREFNVYCPLPQNIMASERWTVYMQEEQEGLDSLWNENVLQLHVANGLVYSRLHTDTLSVHVVLCVRLEVFVTLSGIKTIN